MASDTNDAQPAYMAMQEEEVSFAIRAYTWPQASWHRYRCFFEPLMQKMETMEGGYRYI